MAKWVGTGMCYCGTNVEDHSPYWDNHSPVEVQYDSEVVENL